MSIKLATGTQVAIASAYGTGFTITAISNANPAVATLSASHGVIVGDIIEVRSGWDLIDGRLFRVSAVSTNDVTLEGLNTSSTTDYPAGSGTGTGREVTSWANITQIKSLGTSGGESEFTDITSVADRVRKQMPTVRSATQYELVVYDDPTLSYYSTVQTASDTVALTAMRIVFPDSSRLLANGYWSLQKSPDIAVNEALTARIGLSAFALPTRYST